ncbi:hypothetical protein BEP68_14815 [Microbacterium sp. 4-7]|nr:hypothetical protein [Microbacterium sp. 4-7]
MRAAERAVSEQKAEIAELEHGLRAVRTDGGDGLGTIEGRIYIGTADAFHAFQAFAAVQRLLRDLGATSIEIDQVSEGSVFLTVKSWFSEWAARREVRRIASQLVQTAEAMTVDKAHAENAAVQMSAIAEMVTAGANAGAISIDLGTLQYVQVVDEDGKTQVAARSISSRELADKRIDEATLRDPKAMLEELRRDADESDGPVAV